MKRPHNKKIIGIVGGIGSGKSTAAAEFARLGCAVISADKIVHEILDKTEIKDKIVRTYGENILNDKEIIDRKKLASIVFKDHHKLEALNNIVHPLVLERVQKLINRYQEDENIKVIVLDMPLLFEVGWHKKCDKIIFIDCNEKIRAKRVKNTHNFDENELKLREKFQFSLDNKRKLSDNTINNSAGLPELRKQIEGFFYLFSG